MTKSGSLREFQPHYKVWARPAVHSARKRLPGHVRQQIKRIIDDLGDDPRPGTSIEMTLQFPAPSEWEARRIRIDDWRVIYAINDAWSEVAVLSIQKRPPYDYEDLELLLAEL